MLNESLNEAKLEHEGCVREAVHRAETFEHPKPSFTVLNVEVVLWCEQTPEVLPHILWWFDENLMIESGFVSQFSCDPLQLLVVESLEKSC